MNINAALIVMLFVLTPALHAQDAPMQESQAVLDARTMLHKLHTAVRTGDRQTITEILNGGFNVNDSAAMQLAITMDRADLVDLLIAHGADVNGAALSAEPPLIMAFKQDRIELMKYLVARGADIHRRDQHGKTVLDYAQGQGNPVVIEYLRKMGVTDKVIGKP